MASTAMDWECDHADSTSSSSSLSSSRQEEPWIDRKNLKRGRPWPDENGSPTQTGYRHYPRLTVTMNMKKKRMKTISEPQVTSNTNMTLQLTTWPPNQPAAVVVPPHVDRAYLRRWLHVYWEDHAGLGRFDGDTCHIDDDDSGSGNDNENCNMMENIGAIGDEDADAAASGRDLPFELVLPFETHRALTQAICMDPVPLVEARQKAKLLCYPEASSFLLLPYWPALDHCYACYDASTMLYRLLRDLEKIQHARNADWVQVNLQMPDGGRETRRHEAKLYREAKMALYYK